MVGPFCSAGPTLRDLLYDCPVLNAELGTAPADWSLHLDDPTQQCYWLHGIAPSHWTHLQASVRTDLLGHVEVGGLRANVDVLDGLHLYWLATVTLVRACVAGVSRLLLWMLLLEGLGNVLRGKAGSCQAKLSQHLERSCMLLWSCLAIPVVLSRFLVTPNSISKHCGG